MVALSAMLSMAVAVLFGMMLSPGETYETRVNHRPWWAYETDVNSIENSYQYFYPYHQQQYHKQNNFRWDYPTRNQVIKKKVTNSRWKYPSFNKERKRNNFNWNNFMSSIDFNKIKIPTTPTMKKQAAPTREWPAYHLLPPIRMISPSMDEPPQP